MVPVFYAFVYCVSPPRNSIIDYMLDGTAIKEAIKNGKMQTARSCDEIYSTCPLDRQSTLKLFKKMFPIGN